MTPDSDADGETEELRAAAMQTSREIMAARQRADLELIAAKEAMEKQSAALARSLAITRAMLEATSDAILVTDGNRRFTGCNRNFEVMWSISPETMHLEVPGRLLGECSRLLLDPASFRARLDEIYAGGLVETYDLLEFIDGRIIERFSKTQKIDDVVVGRVWSFRDITERRQVEAALRENEAQFRGTFEQGAVGMSHVSTEGRYLRVNDKLCAILGYEREELLGMTFSDVTIPEDRHLGMKAMSAMLAGEVSTFTADKRYRRRTGEIIWVNLVVSLQRDTAGRPNYFIGVLTDISERKAAEHALRESEARFRELADNLQVAFWIGPPDMREFHYLSPAFEQIWGRSLASMYASVDLWPEFIVPEDRGRVLAAFADLQANSPTIHSEYRITRPDGEVRWISGQAHQILDKDGKLVRLIGLFADVTDRKRIEKDLWDSRKSLRELNADLERRVAQRTAALVAATEEAEQANRAKTEFLSRTSHELRTPMHAILGFGHLLEGEENLTEGARAGVTQILKSANHLLSLINQLLDIAGTSEARRELPLPANVKDRALPLPAAASAEPAPAVPRSAHKSLLYVEQDLSHRRFIARLLARRPAFEVLLAESWAVGLEIARNQTPDLILLDLPADGSGIEKLRELRAAPRTAAIPVVFLGGEDLSGARELMLAIGGCAWVPRPVEVRVLLAAIDQFVQ